MRNPAQKIHFSAMRQIRNKYATEVRLVAKVLIAATGAIAIFFQLCSTRRFPIRGDWLVVRHLQRGPAHIDGPPQNPWALKLCSTHRYLVSKQ